MIRFIIGFLVVFGAIGGIENSASDFDLATACGIAALGLMVMWAGVRNLNSVSAQK